jgi:hypothetical protein
MKHIYILLTVTLVFVIFTCGCMGAGSLSPGTYYNTQDSYNRISLGVDRTFINDGRSGTTDGTYTIDGDMLIAHGDCQTGKGTFYFKRTCGGALEFESYYKISNENFCQIAGKGGHIIDTMCYNRK